MFISIFNLSLIIFPELSSLLCSYTFLKLLWWVFITLKVRINFSWNSGWNICIWRKWIILFNIWLVIWMWLIYLYVLCHHRTSRRKGIFLWCYCSGTWEIIWTYFLDGVGIPLWMLLWWSTFSLSYAFYEKVFCAVLSCQYFWR